MKYFLSIFYNSIIVDWGAECELWYFKPSGSVPEMWVISCVVKKSDKNIEEFCS